MPSSFRTQKDLPQWIELDYYRRARPLRRWRRLLTWAVFLSCAAAVVAATFLTRASRLVQAGPVSSAHAMFNDDCGQCHQERFQTAKKLLPGNADVHAVPDQACTRCHTG